MPISKLQLGLGRYWYHPLDLRIQLAGAGMTLSNQTSNSHFIKSLLPSLDLFATLYDGTSDGVGALCDKFAKDEMWQKPVEWES